MSETLEGGCLCGAVRYSVKLGFRMKPYACHCTDCQTRSGSSFGLQIPVVASDISVTGETSAGEYLLPSGKKVWLHGCPKCLTRLYSTNDRDPLAALRAGTLDSSASVTPAAHFWVRSKQPWIVIPDDVPALDTQPQSPEEWLQLLGPGT
jgi:hypothetical protein